MTEPLSFAERAVAVVDAYIAAFAARDAKAAAELYASQATVEDPVGSALIHGADIPAFYVKAMEFDLRLERTGPVRVSGDYAAFPFRIHYPASAEYRWIDVIDTFRFDASGRVIEMRAFWGPSNVQTSEESPNPG